jgi:histidyl-tRNA synthetase
VHDLLAAIGIGGFTIRVNDRRVLSGILQECGVADRSTDVLRSLDKLGKATPEAVAAELEAHGVSADVRTKLLGMAQLAGDPATVLAALDGLVGSSETGRAGVAALRSLLDGVRQAGVPDGRVVIDPSIARGLDYYTGIVLESFLDDLPALGSICSGGRYDNLTGVFGLKDVLYRVVGLSLKLKREHVKVGEHRPEAVSETSVQVLISH